MTTERYLLPDRRFMNDLFVTFCSQVNLLGASSRKSASQISFATSAVLQRVNTPSTAENDGQVSQVSAHWVLNVPYGDS